MYRYTIEYLLFKSYRVLSLVNLIDTESHIILRPKSLESRLI
eukprot:SAG31_NODE_20477_length_573_cov_0.978903_1_plen_41_part_10